MCARVVVCSGLSPQIVRRTSDLKDVLCEAVSLVVGFVLSYSLCAARLIVRSVRSA